MSKTDDTHWFLHIEGLPAVATYTFAVEAKTADGTNAYYGSAEVTVDAGATTQVAILLQQVNPPPGPSTFAPVLDALSASAVTIAPGGQVSLSASAHQPDGSPLTFRWASACGGSFSAADAAETVWTAPFTESALACQLSLTLSSASASVTSFLVVEVQVAGGV
jgi:hypothetical protein